MNKQSISFAVKIFAAAIFCWLSLHSVFHSYSTDLESSWMYAINAASASGMIFGTDILFTYGPLGYLITPFAMAAHIEHALVAQLALLLVWFILIIRVCANGLSVTRLLIALTLMAFVSQTLTFLWLTVAAGLSLYIYTAEKKEAVYCTVLTCLLVALSALTKFSLGIATAGALGSALVLRTVSRGQPVRDVWTAAAAASLFAVVCISYWFFAGVGNFAIWLRGVWEIASGYSSAMHIAGPRHEIIIAFICLAVFGATLAANFNNRDKRDKYLLFIVLLPVFLSFKLGFVRQDGHVVSFFASLALLTCSTLLFVRSNPAFKKTLPAALVSIIAYVYIAADHRGISNTTAFPGMQSAAIAGEMIRLNDSVQTVKETFEQNLKAEIIDAPALNAALTSTSRVDSIPWDVAVIPANSFIWSPAPVFQFYSAYTPYLDGMNARHYSSEKGADVLLCRFRSTDVRHMLWDTPQTWRAILNHYEWNGDIPEKEMIVMTRRDAPRKTTLYDIGHTAVNADETIPIPDRSDRVYVDIPLEYSVSGHLRKSLFRLPPVYIRIDYDDGSFVHRKLTPDVAANGILVNCVPRNLGEFRDLVKESVTRKAKTLLIHGPGTGLFNWPVKLTWKTDGVTLAAP